MCGITAAIGSIYPKIIDSAGQINNAQFHRGPDSGGFWSSVNDQGQGVVLAHRRLAILDLSSKGSQPMIDGITGNVITYNGEIYNHRELRQELEKKGINFYSDCDTEVILLGYRVWGESILDYLRGMFSFVIWNPQKNHAFCARDRLGIKPFYYSSVQKNDCHTLLIASEVKALLASNLIDRKLNKESLENYLWNGFVISPNTIIDKIFSLPAGYKMIIDLNGGIKRCESYWSMSKHKVNNTSVESLEQELKEAVKMRLMSDVPVGVFLSGGIDSSLVAALSVQADIGTIKTFNLSFEEVEYDESIYAHQVANVLGTEHINIKLSQSQFSNQLENALKSLDQPSFDGLNTYYISRAVREIGIKVVLSGAGGDELFGGYRSFQEIPLALKISHYWSKLPHSLRNKCLKQVTQWNQGRGRDFPPQTRWGKLEDLLSTNGVANTYQVFYSLFTQNFQCQLLDKKDHQNISYGLTNFYQEKFKESLQNEPILNAISDLELAIFLGERLLRDTDATSMANSLEIRLPLIDHHVVNLVRGQTTKNRFYPLGKKFFLRNLMADQLNTQLFERPKSGFVMPIEQWCRQGLKNEISETFNDPSRLAKIGINADAVKALWEAFLAESPGLYWSRIWSIYILCWWCDRHDVVLEN
jgi:asparagine synthase (glutamine-hydrolysing)